LTFDLATFAVALALGLAAGGAVAWAFGRRVAGLERALAVLADDREILEVANRATQHLYFRNPIHKFEERSKGLFSTHPPILDRINRLRHEP